MFRVELEGKLILLANANGTVHACDEMCTHEGFWLEWGAWQGDWLKCSLHGSRLDLKTGKPLDEPAYEDLAVYPVKVEDNKIFVALT